MKEEGNVLKLKKAKVMMTRFYEMGLNDKNYDLMGLTLLPESDVQSVRSELRDCLTNEIVRPNLEFTSKGLNLCHCF